MSIKILSTIPVTAFEEENSNTTSIAINLYLFGCDVTRIIIICRDLHFFNVTNQFKRQFHSLGILTRGDKTMRSRNAMRQKGSVNYWILVGTGGRKQASENVELFSEKIDLGL